MRKSSACALGALLSVVFAATSFFAPERPQTARPKPTGDRFSTARPHRLEARRQGPAAFHEGNFGNCTIRVVYRMQKRNRNSGVFIRIPIEGSGGEVN